MLVQVSMEHNLEEPSPSNQEDVPHNNKDDDENDDHFVDNDQDDDVDDDDDDTNADVAVLSLNLTRLDLSVFSIDTGRHRGLYGSGIAGGLWWLGCGGWGGGLVCGGGCGFWGRKGWAAPLVLNSFRSRSLANQTHDHRDWG